MKLLLANTDFEFELDSQMSLSLEKSMALGNLTLQFQFIPVMYAYPEDCILVNGLPDKVYREHLLSLGLWPSEDYLPQFVRVDTSKVFAGTCLHTWGASKRARQWANEHGVAYELPSWEVVREVNSKAFSFEHSACLPGAALLKSEEEVNAWLQLPWPKKVLKTCFGLASRGHFMIDAGTNGDQLALKNFLQKEFAKSLPVIGEPWVERLLDFSTQWQIGKDKSIRYLGATGIMNTPSGRYMGTIAGKEAAIMGEYLPFLDAHKKQAVQILNLAAAKGYFGYAGLDAMIYHLSEERESVSLHPIVELNARMTMGLAALLFQQRYFPTKDLLVQYCSKEELSLKQQAFALLPEVIWKDDVKKSFKKQLFFSIL